MKVRRKNIEQSVFNWLVKEYYGRVLKTCLYYLKNRHDAEDITQEVFLKAFQKIDFSRLEDSKFPILFTMAKNLSLNKLKSRGWKDESLPEWEMESLYVSPEDGYLKEETVDEVNRTLQTLKKEEREVLMLKHYQECSYKEIAEILDIPVGTVMSRLYTARKKMGEKLKE